MNETRLMTWEVQQSTGERYAGSEHETTLAQWLADNAEPECCDPDDLALAKALKIGESVDIGGGAGALVHIERVS